jgi:uncharacterized SAM-binding protein YcdF (DUF218 family)
MNNTLELAKTLWNYNVLNQKIEKADCIIALGNSDIRTAQEAANLLIQGYSGLLVTTGGFGRLTKDSFTKPEAQLFADEAIKRGVPAEKILIEEKSTNTFDNFRFTKKLLTEKNLKPRSILVVTKPYMERRAFMTACAIWPDLQIMVASPPLDFDNYTNTSIPIDLLVNMLVGDTQRLMIFSESGDIPKQNFPSNVTEAHRELINAGYSKQIIPDKDISNLLKAVKTGNIN